MRILFHPDRPSIDVWLPGGHATLSADGVHWRTPHEPFTLYANGQTDEDVVVGHQRAPVLSGFTDVVDAAWLDDGSVAVVHGRATPMLALVDPSGTTRQVSLQVAATRHAAFDIASGAGVMSDSDSFRADGPRSIRLAPAGKILGIASASSGHVAAYDLDRGGFDFAFRVGTSSDDVLWSLPVPQGLLLGARFRGRWSELRLVDCSGAVLGTWPSGSDEQEGERWGMAAPVVLGEYVVVSTDDRKAYVLQLPSLREISVTMLPCQARDTHGKGDRWAAMDGARVVLGRLDATGKLGLEEVLTPLELMTRAGVQRCEARSVAGVTQRVVARRLEAMFPSEPMLLQTVRSPFAAPATAHEPDLIDAQGAELFADVAGAERKKILDAHGARAVIVTPSRSSLLELATGEETELTSPGILRARVIDHGLWLHEEPPRRPAQANSAFDFAALFSADTVVRYRPDHGESVVLRSACPRELFVAATSRRVVWSEPVADAPEHMQLFSFDPARDARGATSMLVDGHVRNLALDDHVLYGVAGSYEGRIVRIDEDGRVVDASRDVIEWVDVLRDFVVAGGTAYWVTPYSDRAPSKLLALTLGKDDAPRTVYEATFGALTSLIVVGGTLFWLESQTFAAEANGVNVLEPRAIVASLDLQP